MKVLIIGGYGVFGERLSRLLAIDGHDVCVAGRNADAAQNLADEIGCRSTVIDRNETLGILTDYDVVIDAAGPFHTYGKDPYRLAREAISRGTHYLDLSDNAEFCMGIAQLDALAKQAGLCALSGVSSVPALSSAAVRALAKDDQICSIDSAILPGNRAPRGLSVMHSILEQAGRPMKVWRGNRWTQSYGWSDPAHYALPQGVTRQAWQISVPDQQLFPDHFGAESVVFRAGLELAIMRYGLAVFAYIRRFIPFTVTRPIVQLFQFAANLLKPFGSGRGGMSVQIVTPFETRRWSLLAEDGDGPYIPAIPARALLRRKALPVGAGVALEVITLDEAETAMSDLRVQTEVETQTYKAIFPSLLGVEFETLPKAIQRTHLTIDQSHWLGRCKVRRGKGLWPTLLATIFGFPYPHPDTPVEVTKTVTPAGETWIRNIGGRRFRSHLKLTPEGMMEKFGPFVFLIGLTVSENKLQYPVMKGWLGPLRLPNWMLPESNAWESEQDGVFHFDVELRAPITKGLLVRYQGYLKPNKSTPTSLQKGCKT